MNKSLQESDPFLYNLIQQEEKRQNEGLELIASENITSLSVRECLGSVLTNKYSEGLPGKRYYGGNEVIDKIESLCIERALEAFNLDPNEWGVNVQPYSGSVANFAAYSGLLNPGDKLMGLDLPSGGHLTHGFQTERKKISYTSVYFESMAYHVGEDGLIDYDRLEKDAIDFIPQLIICGYSAYPRDLDYNRFRQIANINNSYLLCDMAHYSGLVATGECNNPFEYCDIVTSTTHKTLRGPRSGLIFFRKELEEQINFAVFPGLQGGPHEHQIAAIATQLKEVITPEFKIYIKQVKLNATVMADEFIKLGYDVCTQGTDNHLVMIVVRSKGITGSKIEKICEYVNISINKNAVPGDKSALTPGGIRLGTPALTTRGFKENDIRTVVTFMNIVINIALEIQEETGKPLKKFIEAFPNNKELNKIKDDIIDFASGFDYY